MERNQKTKNKLITLLVLIIGIGILINKSDDNQIKNIELSSDLEIIEPVTRIKIIENEIVVKEKCEIEWFKEYKKTHDIKLPYTPYEINLIQRCIETEVYTAPFECKCNVASVILNRIEDGRWGDISAVIMSKNQFAYNRLKISESTKLALEFVYVFGDRTNGCLSFRSGNKPKYWVDVNSDLKFIDEVGHGFYKQREVE